MNQKTTYEITITEKLEQLPVPDLSDLIWARIERELDADPGDTGNDDGTGPSFPTGGLVLGGIALAFIAALLFYFFNPKQPGPIAPIEIQPFESTAPATPVPGNGLRPPDPAGRQGRAPAPSSNFQGLPKSSDSLALQPIVVDSGSALPQIVPEVLPPSIVRQAGDSVPPKKIRGVRRIGSDEYKITPKRDSL